MLDPTLLRSFLAVIETGSFTRGADHVHLTQSTVSQQIRRLEDLLKCELVDRSGPTVRVTEEGEKLLSYAHRILNLMDEAVVDITQISERGEVRLGVPEDFASHVLTRMLAEFAKNYPGVRLSITSALSGELWQRYQKNELDLVLVKQRAGSVSALKVWPESLCWVDSMKIPSRHKDPLPLVAFPAGALYRNDMTQSLDAQGRNWHIAYTSSSLASISAAVEDGIGVTLLPRRLVQKQHRILSKKEGFPSIPNLELSLHLQSGARHYCRELATCLIPVCERIMKT